MSDYSELKRLAEAATIGDKPASTPIKELIGAQDAFRSECRPEKVLALIAENERLESEAVYSAAGFDAAREEIARLKAEVAGLRTGYQAYERVNAELKAENEALRNAAAPLDPVNGDQLPAINSKVLIHLSSCDAWVEHTVVGYYAWEDLGANESLHRVFIRVRDADGYLNARLLKDVRAVAARAKGEKS